MYLGDKMSEINGDWKVKSATFQGYVKGKIEDIEEDVKEIKQELKGLNGFDKQIALKVGGLATGASILVTLIMNAIP